MAEEPQSEPAGDDAMVVADAPAPNHAGSSAAPTASSLPAVSSNATVVETASSPYSTSSPNDDDIQPPPAKRARKHSDADQASLANVRYPVLYAASGVLIQIYFCCLFEDRYTATSICVACAIAGEQL